MANIVTYKNKPIEELLQSEFDEFNKESWLDRNKREYGKDKNGIDLKIPKGYRLLQLGEEIPSTFGKYTITSAGNGVWTYHTSRSTMIPIFSMLSGSDKAFIVKDDNE